MAREEARGKRPFKIWDSWRNVRKGLVVNSFEELLLRGKEKLGVPVGEPVRLVLDSDGTQVEDGEYFRTLPNNTVLLLLRPGERWFPTGVDVIRAAISAIPKIVCETIHALELHDETPSWKIMDNKGRVTVVLHWDQRQGRGDRGSSEPSPGGPKFSPSKKSSGEMAGGPRPSLVIQTSLDKIQGIHDSPGTIISSGGKRETLINDIYAGAGGSATRLYTSSPQITVINHDDVTPAKGVTSSYGVHHPRLHKQGSSFESTTIHIHTPECANHAHHPAARSGSPTSNGVVECDFHCCALHEEGRKIAVHKSVATSPIQDAQQQTSPQPPSSLSDGTKKSGQVTKGTGHVRFLDVEDGGSSGSGGLSRHSQNEHDSSESETENTIMEDEAVTSEKFLLLIDQLSVDQKRHLTIKDIGIILERLNSKILDVEKLERDYEANDCYNWTIKATIRGDVLRELGVIYNGNYYAISEHPGYKEDSEENNEEAEEEEEEDII